MPRLTLLLALLGLLSLTPTPALGRCAPTGLGVAVLTPPTTTVPRDGSPGSREASLFAPRGRCQAVSANGSPVPVGHPARLVAVDVYGRATRSTEIVVEAHP